MEQMTLAEIVQDIHAMDEELWHYESRYGLRTRYFLELYEAGQLHDEDTLQTRDYSDWAACYEIKQHREQLYEAAVREILKKASKQSGISLSDLKRAWRPVPLSAGALQCCRLSKLIVKPSTCCSIRAPRCAGIRSASTPAAHASVFWRAKSSSREASCYVCSSVWTSRASAS